MTIEAFDQQFWGLRERRKGELTKGERVSGGQWMYLAGHWGGGAIGTSQRIGDVELEVKDRDAVKLTFSNDPENPLTLHRGKINFVIPDRDYFKHFFGFGTRITYSPTRR